MAAKMKGTRNRQDNFLPNSEPRAPVKARNRKRRPSGGEPMPLQIKDHAIKSISGMRTTCHWDLDQESTDAILEDIGVSFMEEDNIHESVAPTPPTYLHDSMVPPPAPRICMSLYPQQTVIAGGDHNGSHIATPSLVYMEPQGTIDDTFLFKRARSDTVAGTDHWTKLSDEIVLSILRWLPKAMLVRCARVCKRWNRLAFDETLWRRMDLANKTLKAGVVGRVLQRGVAVLRLTKTEIQTPIFLESNTASFNSSTWSSGIGSANNSLNLSMDTSMNNSCMSMDTSMSASVHQPRLTRVQYLDLSMATISVEGLEELLANTHYLRKLSLENCEVNDTICRYIGQNRNLEVLNMCMCQGMTENGLVPICNNLQRLEALNVGWTNMSRGAVVYLLICLPLSLLKLNLSGCRDTLMDEDVQQLCGSCPHLKELDLSDATMLTSQSVEHIAAQVPGLEYVALSRCYHIAPSSFTLLGNITTLLAIDVFGMLKESALQQLREAMPNIEINKFPFSSIARPTTGIRRTSIWGLRVRDSVV